MAAREDGEKKNPQARVVGRRLSGRKRKLTTGRTHCYLPCHCPLVSSQGGHARDFGCSEGSTVEGNQAVRPCRGSISSCRRLGVKFGYFLASWSTGAVGLVKYPSLANRLPISCQSLANSTQGARYGPWTAIMPQGPHDCGFDCQCTQGTPGKLQCPFAYPIWAGQWKREPAVFDSPSVACLGLEHSHPTCHAGHLQGTPIGDRAQNEMTSWAARFVGVILR